MNGGLGGGVDNDRRPDLTHQGEDALAVADVRLMVLKARQFADEAGLVPAGVALRTKEHGALVVVHAMDGEAVSRKETTDLRADEAGGAGDENLALAHASSCDGRANLAPGGQGRSSARGIP
jgi:hypothetical protein